MYALLYHPRTLKFLKKLSTKQSKKTTEKIELLIKNPFITADVKKLATTQQSYRLRVGKIRVIYEVDDKTKTIYIHDIDFRGNIY